MNRISLISFALPLLIISACFSPGEIDPTLPKAAIEIRLIDAPGDVQEVNIDLQQLQIKTKDTNGFVDLNTNAGIYDLLLYQAGQDTVIVNDSIPAGEIQELRMILGSDNSVMVDSVLYDLKVPSGMQSGIKIKFNQIAVADSLTTVTLDFDAQKSIVAKGNGTYSLKPVIKAIQ